MSRKPTPQEYALIFEDHKIGAAILEDLTQIFARPAVVKGGIDAVLETYQRDGQRRVLEYIVSQINRAQGVDVNQEEENPS